MRLSGSITALATPFTVTGELDLDAWRRLLHAQIEGGTQAVVVAGSTGEAASLYESEHDALLRTAVECVAGRVPVLAGTGQPGTARTIEATRRAAALGADAALVVVPPYVRPTQAGLLAHFKAIADDDALPLVMYNVPQRSGCDLRPDAVAGLVAHPRIVGIKEAVADPERLLAWQALRRRPDPAQCWAVATVGISCLHTLLEYPLWYAHFLCLMALLGGGGEARAQEPQHMRVTLVPETRSVPPGGTVTLAFVMEPERGWHGYWRNPGDAGAEPRVEWRLPPGWEAGPLLYPVPDRKTLLGLMNYVYEGDHALLARRRAPAAARPGTVVPLVARLDYLVCTDDLCVPETATVSARRRSKYFGGPLSGLDSCFDRALEARDDACGGYRDHIPSDEELRDQCQECWEQCLANASSWWHFWDPWPDDCP